MYRNEQFSCRLALCILMLWVCSGPYVVASELPDADGVFGMHSDDGGAWIAVKVPVPQGQALAGVSWYNNDGTTVFSEVLVGTGYENSPGVVGDFLVVARDVQGGSSAYSDLTFDQPVAASLAGLYVVFRLPVGEELTDRGIGGGPGIGYGDSASGLTGWISGEGEIWAQLHEDYGFLVVPRFIEADDSMQVKSLGDDEEGDLEAADRPLTVSPNPFNPATEIQFGVARPSDAKVGVYDLRGRRIAQLLDGVVAAGDHSVVWRGADDRGRAVASGMYVVRLDLGRDSQHKTITLVK